LKLSKGYAENETDVWLDLLIPIYVQILQELEKEGVTWVQMDEPIVVANLHEADLERLNKTISTSFHCQ